MDKPTFDRIIRQLMPAMSDEDARRAIVESALHGSRVLEQIKWSGAARPFTVRLVRQLDEFGQLDDGTLALIALLEEVKSGVGADRQKQLDDLIAQLSTPGTPLPDITPPEETIDDDLYIFLSYARPEAPIAEQVEKYLTAAGVRVFRDVTSISEGDNWDMAIEKGLQEAERMVLLLSASSMPYRKEVHREWFFFDQKRKPIYPLYVQECELHSRLYAYNYIDARTDLQAALDRLLKKLKSDYVLPDVAAGADKIGVFEDVEVEERSLPESLQALHDAILDPAGDVVLSVEQANAVKGHKPADPTEYRLGRIAEWSLPRYQLDNRFVNLTLMLDKGEDAQQRWERAADFRFNDLREVLGKVDDPALVLLGAPGSGKSTLLRRLQLDHSIDQIRANGDGVSFFIPLNSYRPPTPGKPLPSPLEWLSARWQDRYPQLSPLESYLRNGNTLLLLDALNEMPHRDTAHYHEKVALWRAFAQDSAAQGNRILFSCRSLDYSATLSSKTMPVPQIEVQPMNGEQVRAFLAAYIPAQQEMVWKELDGSPQFDLFQTPYFLKLLCEQVEATQTIPKGRASLFTGFVRQTLYRELGGELFQPDTLLSAKDHQKLSLGKWRTPFDLPERGVLIPKLSQLAFTMQENSVSTESKQVRIDYDDACDLLDHERDEDILKAGVSMNVLDEDVTQYEITYFHQLLQEYFAARQLAADPNPSLVHVEWEADKVTPSLEETIAGLGDGDPLPALPQTGWEETSLTAAPMSKNPNTFIRAIMPHNLPLAARCAASGDVTIDPDLKAEIQQALIARTQDMNADLRARISAGLALGELGDPRFERRTGPHGDYLQPPMIDIPAGEYPMGLDNAPYDREEPAHTVPLEAFQIGQFPVTNAEYALFMEAGGYEDEQWWETEEAKAWLRGEGSTEGQKQQWRDNKQKLESWSEEHIQSFVTQNRITSEQANDWLIIRSWTNERLEDWLEENFPTGAIYREPEYWNDVRFNSPAQPVVGVTWFEARAYCAWLSAQTGLDFELPTEAQFEAAARGLAGRLYPYGDAFEVSRSNTFESHIRRTTPVGIYDNATPEGAFDLSGNTYTWTLSVYDQAQFPYPYHADDGREDTTLTNTPRVLRGGSCYYDQDGARAAYRNLDFPGYRIINNGFRVCASPFS